MIEAALADCHGRISGYSGAAAKLGIPRQTLESKIRMLGINKFGLKRQAACSAVRLGCRCMHETALDLAGGERICLLSLVHGDLPEATGEVMVHDYANAITAFISREHRELSQYLRGLGQRSKLLARSTSCAAKSNRIALVLTGDENMAARIISSGIHGVADSGAVFGEWLCWGVGVVIKACVILYRDTNGRKKRALANIGVPRRPKDRPSNCTVPRFQGS